MRAFTLTETLIVVAIIGILIGLLMPALARSREAARQAACASNLRQVATAFIAYANDNRGWPPGPSCGGCPLPHDWVWWQRDVRQSALARYLPRLKDVLVCPSDTPTFRPNRIFPADGAYPYSYSANVNIVSNPVTQTRPVMLSRIRHSSEVVLLVDESAYSVNDGTFIGDIHPPDVDLLSIVHETAKRQRAPITGTGTPTMEWPRSRGNVVFVDGHVDFISRTEVQGQIRVR